jgi:hypothetical protein
VRSYIGIVAGSGPKDSSPDVRPGGKRPGGTPLAIWFARLLLLVQGGILAIGTAIALTGLGSRGINEAAVVGAVVAMVPACACFLVAIYLRRGRPIIVAAAIVLEGLWIFLTGLLGMWPSGAIGNYGPPDLLLGIASVTAFIGLLCPPARRFSSLTRDVD